MIHPLFFNLFSGLAVAGALGVILSRHPVYGVLSLVATMFSLSGLFLLLGAPFVAAIQVLVYAGAILVLFLFVVMLLDIAPETLRMTRAGTLRLLGLPFGGFFLWQLAGAASSFRFGSEISSQPEADGTTAAVGKLLFTTYALPFEAASLLLLVGAIGAVVLAKKKL
ncbi:MAG: NADH-quinone oxidoreductase subunit J [Candidatus Omnitrophica bacterium]|nr:NADH-quinone oxidoreductase subunit J [Candidatus Omnitrophota bacterium]